MAEPLRCELNEDSRCIWCGNTDDESEDGFSQSICSDQIRIPWQRQEPTIPPACRGETCTLCGAQATHKVAEENLADGWPTHGHAAYVCDLHFAAIFRPHEPKLTRVLFRSPSAPPLATTLEGISLLRTAADTLRQVGADVVLDARLFGDQLERLADLWEDDADRLTALEAISPQPRKETPPRE